MAKIEPTTAATASWWRLPSLRWLVPLTAAAAAAAIVWFVVPVGDRAMNVRQVSQVAESIPPPGAATAPVGSAPAITTAPANDGAPPAGPAASSRTLREQDTLRRDNGVAADKKEFQAKDANAAPETPARGAEARAEKAQAADAPVAAAPPAAPAAARVLSFAASEPVVVSSNPASRWRILRGGAVQRSADAGSTWEMQNTGVTETLTAGASPSPSVCWLVGPGGIVLLSTDGRSWKRVGFPEALPLVAVRATDQQTATVTTADGREFVTEDGGLTWARAPGR
jgi:hypothetical protein